MKKIHEGTKEKITEETGSNTRIHSPNKEFFMNKRKEPVQKEIKVAMKLKKKRLQNVTVDVKNKNLRKK